MWKRSSLGLLLASLGPAAAQAPLPVAQDPLLPIRETILQALDRLNLGPGELAIDAGGVGEATMVERILHAPLLLPQVMEDARSAAATLRGPRRTMGPLRAALRVAGQPALPTLAAGVGDARTLPAALELLLGERPKTLPGVSGHAAEGLRGLFQAAASLRIASEKAWILPWAPAERDAALQTLASIVGTRGPAAEVDARLREAQGFDRAALAAHVCGALDLLDDALVALTAASPAELPGPVQAPGVEGDVRWYLDTALGPIVIGGPGATRYTCDPFLVVDFGGDDVYAGGIARAVRRPAALAVDLGGDDTYLGGGSWTQAAAMGGVALLLDLGGGRDRYVGEDGCQAAALCGAALLLDDGGSDVFEGRSFVQGAAAFGFSVLADVEGSDRYEAAAFGQGFGGVQGAGLLLDAAGADLYSAGRGGELASEDAWCQGVGAGDRRHGVAGGAGLLWDGGGDDVYLASGGAQGAGYWLGLGMLVDESGDDCYFCGRYGQGSGIHLAAGGLWDLGGRDSYVLRDAVGQGGAHDLAVGLLLDGDGDDRYLGGTLTQGAGNQNGCGFLLDLRGDDSYAGSGVDGMQQGNAIASRGYGSLGLLLDGAGHDEFSTRGADRGVTWQRGQWGLAWDVGWTRESPPPPPQTSPRAEPMSPLPADNEQTYALLFARAADGPESAQARATLVALGRRAGQWIVDSRLGAWRASEVDAMCEVVEGIGKALVPGLRQGLRDGDPQRRRNALELLGRLQDDYAVPGMIELLTGDPEPSVRRKAAACLSRLAAPAALPGLVALAASEDVRDRRAAALALPAIPGLQAVHKLCDLLDDPSFTVRDPARDGLLARRAESMPIGLGELIRVRGKALREWLRLFAIWRPAEAQEPLARLAAGEDAEVARLARAILATLEAPSGRAPAKDGR